MTSGDAGWSPVDAAKQRVSRQGRQPLAALHESSGRTNGCLFTPISLAEGAFKVGWRFVGVPLRLVHAGENSLANITNTSAHGPKEGF
jgi:hypothetical protein